MKRGQRQLLLLSYNLSTNVTCVIHLLQSPFWSIIHSSFASWVHKRNRAWDFPCSPATVFYLSPKISHKLWLYPSSCGSSKCSYSNSFMNKFGARLFSWLFFPNSKRFHRRLCMYFVVAPRVRFPRGMKMECFNSPVVCRENPCCGQKNTTKECPMY